MLKPTVLEALQSQVQQEMSNSYTYRAAALWLDQQMLHGLAAWFRKQSADEADHAQRFIDYLTDRGAAAELRALAAPKNSYGSLAELIQATHGLERHTSAAIHSLHALAVKEGDLPTQQVLQWFIMEQVEEEKWSEEFLQMVKKIGDHVGSVFMWDHRVGKLAVAPE